MCLVESCKWWQLLIDKDHQQLKGWREDQHVVMHVHLQCYAAVPCRLFCYVHVHACTLIVSPQSKHSIARLASGLSCTLYLYKYLMWYMYIMIMTLLLTEAQQFSSLHAIIWLKYTTEQSLLSTQDNRKSSLQCRPHADLEVCVSECVSSKWPSHKQ